MDRQGSREEFRHRAKVSTLNDSGKLIDSREISFQEPPVLDIPSLQSIIFAQIPPYEGDERLTRREISSLGFYAAGHQYKGKKHKLECDDDLAVMYSMHDTITPGARRSTIFLWAELKQVRTDHGSALGPGSASAGGTSTSRTASGHSHAASKSAVGNSALLEKKLSVLEELKASHAGQGFSDEQLQVWAFMVVQGTADVDEPPRKRFFGHRPKQSAETNTGEPTSAPKPRLEKRDQLFRQLREVKELQVMGAIDEEEFTRQRSNILKDLY